MTSVSSVTGRLPSGVDYSRAPGIDGGFLQAKPSVFRRGHTGPVTLPRLRRFLALRRDGLYWMHPAFGRTTGDVPAQTQFLLWEREDRTFGVLIPLLAGDFRTTLGSTAQGVRFNVDGAGPDSRLPDNGDLALVASGRKPYELIDAAMQAVCRHTGAVRMRRDKPAPRFSDYLGWCTWDAFYHEVSETKVMRGLRSFRKGGVSPRVVILDDGWEQYEGDFLDSFEPDRKKFPRGLKPMISRARSEFGVELFGIHHPFQGYWAGVNPKGELASRYRLKYNRGNIRPWLGPDKQDLYLVDPRDIHRFYDDFYAYLRSQGADMVKVDGQSALELFTEGKLGRVSTMRAYQGALQGAAGYHFLGELIPCMSNGSDVALHLNSTNGWRNSHDYFPKRGPRAQKTHIVCNAMNAVWTSTFAQPDWDMFQSHQPHAAYHAAARAISGGPVYVCDKPGKQNFDILNKLVLSDGRVLRCDQPALPARDCLFTDCARRRRLLKIVNRNRDVGVVGLFHCTETEENVSGTVRMGDVPGLNAVRCAAWRHDAGTLEVMVPSDRLGIELESMGYEIVTLAPVVNGVAPLGLLDKYNCSGAVVRFDARDTNRIECALLDGGTTGFYAERRPSMVLVDGVRAHSTYDRRSGLLTCAVRTGAPRVVTIEL